MRKERLELVIVTATVHCILTLESNFSRRQEQAAAISFEIFDETLMPDIDSGVE